MYYRITEISSEKTAEVLTYVLVKFWANEADALAEQPPVLVNDFRLALRNTVRRIVTDDNGWLKLIGGTYLNPVSRSNEQPGDFEWYDKPVDVAATVRQQIVRYWKRAQRRGAAGDEMDHRIKRDTHDPHAILAREDVENLRDSGLTVEGE